MIETSSATPPRDSLPVVLTIAGSDSGGGAGIQADLLTFAAHGVFGTTAQTCLTAQNPQTISAIKALGARFVLEQIHRVTTYFNVQVIKTGMLFNRSIIKTVARFLEKNPQIKSVVDPVMVSSSGTTLFQPNAIEVLKKALLPRATIITPNLDEAALLLKWRPDDRASMLTAACELTQTYNVATLLKGGHLAHDKLIDVLIESPGAEPKIMSAQRVAPVNTHGSGCTLSAAIAAELARGHTLSTAVTQAHAYLQKTLHHPLRLRGESFINHGVG